MQVIQEIQKLGQFYIGKPIDSTTGKLIDEPLFYDSKNLTTHAVCVGMTGSGKTGLGISLLEEAALDKIPAIIIDPKGDLGNLLLTFPHLSAEEFRPWVDAGEAERKDMTQDEYAVYISNIWKNGLAAWGEGPERIQKFRESVDLTIYTPANNAGIPLSILSSFAAPPKDQLLDTGAIRDKILSITSSLLGLLGIDADPIKSREHILISTLILEAWQKGINVDITSLIGQVQTPPFAKIGALDIDTFYPPKDRMSLSISLNNLLASPGFQAWMQGEPLDIQNLLYTKTGKPKLSIISIAHLSDSERMFFVTLLLNECLTWMRRQPGTSSLRALLYMDEIFGFFPPIAAPPSKLPMLTLLKQARAFGLGIVLATQNPVDLDYKGLSNCGTWFIGKLQTDRDKARVVEGLRIASNGEMDANSLTNSLALTGNRTFIMRSIYEKEPILFQTRWSLSYLRGPLTLAQIAILMGKQKKELETPFSNNNQKATSAEAKPTIPPGISEYFALPATPQRTIHYEPRILGLAKLHFVDSKNKIDTWQDISLALPTDEDGTTVHWEEGTNDPNLKNILNKEPDTNSTFGDLPPALMQEKTYAAFAKDFAASLYQNQTLTLFQSSNPNIISQPSEEESDFRKRISNDLQVKLDEAIKKLEATYAAKTATLADRLQRAELKLAEKQKKTWMQSIETAISFGATILGAIFGRGLTKGTITQTSTTLRRATQIGKDSQSTTQAGQEVELYQSQIADLKTQQQAETEALNNSFSPASIALNSVVIRPRKTDIAVEKIALIWWPQ